jgi:hypothetical protein
MNKATWKVHYRLLRIARREALKAAVDAISFGAGFTMITADGEIRHIPYAEVSPCSKNS